MRKIWLVVLMISTIYSAKSQGVPNSGFEVWSSLGGPIEMPDGWVGGPSVTKSTDMKSGIYAIQLRTDTFTNPMTLSLDTIPGRAITGTPGMGPGSQPTPGFAFANRPDSIKGYTKYMPAGQDTFSIRVVLTKWNSVTGSADIISDTRYLGHQSSAYERFSLPLQYMSANLPDTAIVEIQSSISDPQNPNMGSVLLIDDLDFVTNFSTGFSNTTLSIQTSFVAYPNPVRDNLELNQLSGSSIKIYDIRGSILLEKNIQGLSHLKINLSSYPNGLYLIRQDNQASKSFTIKH